MNAAANFPTLRFRVPRAPLALGNDDVFGPWEWSEIPRLPPFARAEDGRAPRDPTVARLTFDDKFLAVRFDCTDRDAWGTFTERDAPLWQEEVVELFLAPGLEVPRRYFEFELSPNGALFDAVVENPDARRDTMTANIAWNCEGIRWRVSRAENGNNQDWWAILVLPWRSLWDEAQGPRPTEWRGNLYRIERPRGEDPEFTAWSPTFKDPADFHRPARFGAFWFGS